MRIVFFGTPVFAADLLDDLLKQHVTIVAVVTKQDQPKGRSGKPIPSAVKLLVENQTPQIPLLQPENVSSDENAAILQSYKADLFVVVAYGEILKQRILDIPRLGCINVHASLLPKYRGAAPIQRSIMQGDATTGITIMYMDRKMDTGDMIEKVEIPIHENATLMQIQETLCSLGSKTLLSVLHNIEKGIIKRTPQDHSQATYAAKIELEECEIHWNLPARTLHDLIRGVFPAPGAWCFVIIREQKKRMKINKTEVVNITPRKTDQPGSVITFLKDEFIVACGNQALRILELQIEGKKAMSASEFIRGLPLCEAQPQIKFLCHH